MTQDVPEGGKTSACLVFLPSQYVLLFDPSVGEEGGAAVVPTTVKSFQSPGRFVDNTETDASPLVDVATDLLLMLLNRAAVTPTPMFIRPTVVVWPGGS